MLAILSDIHGNLSALQAVVAHACGQGCTRFISLGDVVGYYAEPGECIDVLRSLNAINIMGNHDSYLALDETCPRSKVVSEIIAFQKGIVNADQLAWLQGSRAQLRQNGCLFVHGGPEDPRDQYLYAISRSRIPDGVQLLCSGHTHVQAYVDFGDRGYCNPGSVGQPRDGDCRAAYATLADGRITLHRVPYDIDRTAEKMKAAGFEPFCYENLYIGAQIGGRIDRIKILDDTPE